MTLLTDGQCWLNLSNGLTDTESGSHMLVSQDLSCTHAWITESELHTCLDNRPFLHCTHWTTWQITTGLVHMHTCWNVGSQMANDKCLTHMQGPHKIHTHTHTRSSTSTHTCMHAHTHTHTFESQDHLCSFEGQCYPWMNLFFSNNICELSVT